METNKIAELKVWEEIMDQDVVWLPVPKCWSELFLQSLDHIQSLYDEEMGVPEEYIYWLGSLSITNPYVTSIGDDVDGR